MNARSRGSGWTDRGETRAGTTRPRRQRGSARPGPAGQQVRPRTRTHPELVTPRSPTTGGNTRHLLADPKNTRLALVSVNRGAPVAPGSTPGSPVGDAALPLSVLAVVISLVTGRATGRHGFHTPVVAASRA